MRKILLRTADAKPYFFLNVMNKKRLTYNVFHCVLVSVCRFTVFFLALLRNA